MRLRFQGLSTESTRDAGAIFDSGEKWVEAGFLCALFGTTALGGFCVARSDVHHDFFLGG